MIKPTQSHQINANTPQELKDLPQWVLWRYQTIRGKDKPKKPPLQINGKAASVSEPQTWTTYAAAINALDTQPDRYQGIGLMLQGGLVVIDLDNCLTTVNGQRRITKAARQIYDRAHSYTEISPSGKGLHIFLFGRLPAEAGATLDGMKTAQGEIYERKRYITVTGERIGSATTIRHDQDAINAICDLLRPKKPEQPRQETPHQERQAAKQTQRTRYTSRLNDQQVTTKASNAGNAAKFNAAFSGNFEAFYTSKSEAILGLIQMLLYWTNG